MLLGEYEHTLDDKNRLTLPAKFRTAMADGVVLTRGLDSCVEAYPLQDWTDLVERELGGLNPLSRESRQLERFYYSGAVVPQSLLEHAGLGREVVVIGMRGRVEIWDRAAWRAQLKEVMEGAEHVAERLAAQHD